MKKIVLFIFLYYIIALVCIKALDTIHTGCEICGYRYEGQFCPHCGGCR